MKFKFRAIVGKEKNPPNIRNKGEANFWVQSFKQLVLEKRILMKDVNL